MVKLLVVIVLVLAVIAVAQLARVYEISSVLRSKREEEISFRDNKLNAFLMIVFMVILYAGFIFLMYKYGDGGLPQSASVHGDSLDALLSFNWVIIISVFFLTNTLLFVFSAKYYYRKDRKALYYPHNNKLEVLWTVVPAVVLAVIIIYGLRTWQTITGDSQGNVWDPVTEVYSQDTVRGDLHIELYARQFDWDVRYGGVDTVTGEYQVLGDANYLLLSSTDGKANPFGLITADAIDSSRAYYRNEIEAMEMKLDLDKKLSEFSEAHEALVAAKIKKGYMPEGGHHVAEHTEGGEEHSEGHHGMAAEEGHGDDHGSAHDPHDGKYGHDYMALSMEQIDAHLVAIADSIREYKGDILSNPAREEMEERVARYKRFEARLYQMSIDEANGEFENAADDIMVTAEKEFYLPVNREVNVHIRSKDIIHSAYMPHFRAQMNAVPGMETPFRFTPKLTTAEMREHLGDPDFDYILLCNKICGASHYNMWMKVVVVSQEEFDAWLMKAAEKPFEAAVVAAGESMSEDNETPATDMTEGGQEGGEVVADAAAAEEAQEENHEPGTDH